MIAPFEICPGLIRRIATRDHAAMEELCLGTSRRLLPFILRIVKDPNNAEEVLQDVYRQVWTQASGWSPERGNPEAWIFTIARTRAFDHLRRVRRNAPSAVYNDRFFHSTFDDPEEACRKQWFTSQMTLAMMALPENQRTMIGLAFYDGYSHTEIAEETGLPLGTIKSRIRSAINRMRSSLPSDAFLARA